MKRKTAIIIVCVVLSLLAIEYLFLFRNEIFGLFNHSKNNEITIFFLKDSDKYALFNDDGKQLTDFEFTNYGYIIDNKAVVMKDGDYGIIDSKGNFVVDFGQYSYISTSGNMFQVNSDNKGFLLDSSGKILYDLSDYGFSSYFYEDKFYFLKNYTTKEQSVINSYGDNLISFSYKDGEDVWADEEDGIISIYYDNNDYIFDLDSHKKIASFSTNEHYCVNKVSDDGVIILNSCVSWLEEQDVVHYRVIKNNKLYDDMSNVCDSFSYYDYLKCYKGSEGYILDSNLNLGFVADYKAFYSTDSYISMKGSSAVEFYKKDNLVNTVSCRKSDDITSYGEFVSDQLYILKGYDYGSDCKDTPSNYEYYNSDGVNVFSRSFAKASHFDSNNLAIVSDDGESFYLINKSGKIVSDLYKSIKLEGKYYIVSNDDYKGVLDKSGKVILDLKFKSVEIKDIQSKDVAVLSTDDGYEFYNLDNKKVILSCDNYSYTSHYISFKSDGVVNYYTFNGKKFLELSEGE